MTDAGRRVAMIIKNKISTVNAILDEEHVNCLNGEVSYKSWRATNSRLLKQYGMCVRSAYRAKESGEIVGEEAESLINLCKSERSLARQRADVVRKIMDKKQG